MTNLEVTIYLNTPLIALEDKKSELIENISRIRGKLISQEKNGFLVQVKAIFDDKSTHNLNTPFKKIFVPIHKIDFMAIE